MAENFKTRFGDLRSHATDVFENPLSVEISDTAEGL
jgi:hypothetical protein